MNRSTYDESIYYVSDNHLRDTAHRRAVEQAQLGQPARSTELLASVRRGTASALYRLGKRIEPRPIVIPELTLQHETVRD